MRRNPKVVHISRGDQLKRSRQELRSTGDNQRRSQTASINPDDLDDGFDLLYELEENRDAYSAEKEPDWLSMTDVPGYLLTAVDTCRANCESVKSPSQACTLTCCIVGGLPFFHDDEEIKALIDLKEDLHSAAGEAKDSEAVEMGAEFFRHYPLGIPGTIAKATRVNIPMPPAIKRQVSERASELGIGIGQMGVLCVMVTISSQTVVHPKHSELAGETIRSFIRGVRLRRRVAQVFLEEAQREESASCLA